MADDIFQKILIQLKTLTSKISGDKDGGGAGITGKKGLNNIFGGLKKILPNLAQGGGKTAAFARLAITVGRVVGVFGLIISAGVILAKTFVGIFTKIRDNGEKLIEHLRQYSQFSGKMAAVFAKYDYEELMRKREFANATAESTQRLLEAQSRLKDAMQPWEISIQNLQNDFQSAISNFTAGFLESANEFFEGLSGLSGEVVNPEGQENWGEMIYEGIMELVGIEDSRREDEKQARADEKARKEKEKDPNNYIKELFIKLNKGEPVRDFRGPLFDW